MYYFESSLYVQNGRKVRTKCLEKLSNTHYIVHAHGNNYGSVVNKIPDVIELTYVNKNCFNLVPKCFMFFKIVLYSIGFLQIGQSFVLSYHLSRQILERAATSYIFCSLKLRIYPIKSKCIWNFL